MKKFIILSLMAAITAVALIGEADARNTGFHVAQELFSRIHTLAS